MKLFLNTFLAGFLADGCFSFANGLFLSFAGSDILSAVQYLISLVVFILSLSVYIVSGINASIPKKFMFPLIFFLLWALTAAQPLPLLLEKAQLHLALSLMQVLLGLAVFASIKLKTGSWFITDTLLSSFSFRLKNTLGFFTGNLILLPVVTLILIFASIQTFLSQKTAGFMRLSTDGIYMKEKIFQKNDKLIRLVGMIHIGEGDYFKSLTDSLSDSDSILLAEGVSDEKHLIQNGFSTKGFAKLYGLSSQEDMSLNGDLISPAQLVSSDFPQTGGGLNIVRADVDVKSFSQDTIDFLNMAGEYIFREDSFAAGINEYNDWIQTNTSPALVANITSDIIDKRNKKVISLITPALEKYQTVIVPWGAMHMPAIETAVRDKGFSMVKTTERQSIVFSFSRFKKLILLFTDSQ